MTTTKTKKLAISPEDVAIQQVSGCQCHRLISPTSVGSTKMIMGTVTFPVKSRFFKHAHPHSEKCIYILRGRGKVVFDDEAVFLRAGQALLIPQGIAHSIYNLGDEEMLMLLACAPLAPSPKEGHIILEQEGDS